MPLKSVNFPAHLIESIKICRPCREGTFCDGDHSGCARATAWLVGRSLPFCAVLTFDVPPKRLGAPRVRGFLLPGQRQQALGAFAVEHLAHDADCMSLATAAWVCAIRRMRSTRSAGRRVSLTSTDCTPQFSRSRAGASRSRAVITITGMSRHPGSPCKVATT